MRSRKPPSYLKHRGPDGVLRARTVVRWPDGRVKHRSLGRYGSPESHAEHARLVAEWRAAWAEHAEAPALAPAGPVRTVAELIARFWRHAEQHYRKPDGTPKGELANYRAALRPLLRLYGHTPSADFGPRALKALRGAMARGDWRTPEDRARCEREGRPPGWCRRTCNRNLKRIKLLFRWAESEELVPRGTHHALATVPGLAAGEGGVRESDDVPPVPAADLERTLPHCNHVVAALVRLQLLTGARPGELVRLRPCDLQRSGKVELGRGLVLDAGRCWAFRPKQHKTAHKNRQRTVLFGPRAQEVLAPLLEGRADDAPLFSAAEAVAAWRARQRAARKTKVQPSQASRAKAAPKKAAGAYTVGSYQKAVGKACEKAGVPHWAPGQLRHNAATRLAEQFGEEVARIVLGHSSVEMTRVYALPDLQRAVEAIGKVG